MHRRMDLSYLDAVIQVCKDLRHVASSDRDAAMVSAAERLCASAQYAHSTGDALAVLHTALKEAVGTLTITHKAVLLLAPTTVVSG